MKNSKFTPATFVIDGNDPEGQQIEVKGIHNPAHNWNGFAVPYFDKETAQRLCETLGGDVLEFSKLLDCVLQIEEFNDGIKVLTECGTITIDGVKYYAAGDSWTWLVARHPFDQLAEELDEFCTAYNLPKMSADELAAEIREQLDDLIELQRNREELAERIERAKTQLHFLNDFVARWDSIGK
jgi:hypothetical protein